MDAIGYVDPLWLSEMMRQKVRDWCPECEPDLDQTKEYVIVYRFRPHTEMAVAGDVDWMARCDQRVFPNQPINETGVPNG